MLFLRFPISSLLACALFLLFLPTFLPILVQGGALRSKEKSIFGFPLAILEYAKILLQEL